MAIKKICLRLVDSGDEIFIHIIYCLCNFTCEPNTDSLSMDRWRGRNNSHVTVTGMRKSQWWGRATESMWLRHLLRGWIWAMVAVVLPDYASYNFIESHSSP